jgi:hypothetical protein
MISSELLEFIQNQPEFEKIVKRFNDKILQKQLPIDLFSIKLKNNEIDFSVIKRRNPNEMETVMSVDINDNIIHGKGKINFIVRINKCLIFLPHKKEFDNIEFDTAKSLKSKGFKAIFFDSECVSCPGLFEFLSLVN